MNKISRYDVEHACLNAITILAAQEVQTSSSKRITHGKDKRLVLLRNT